MKTSHCQMMAVRRIGKRKNKGGNFIGGQIFHAVTGIQTIRRVIDRTLLNPPYDLIVFRGMQWLCVLTFGHLCKSVLIRFNLINQITEHRFTRNDCDFPSFSSLEQRLKFSHHVIPLSLRWLVTTITVCLKYRSDFFVKTYFLFFFR